MFKLNLQLLHETRTVEGHCCLFRGTETIKPLGASSESRGLEMLRSGNRGISWRGNFAIALKCRPLSRIPNLDNSLSFPWTAFAYPANPSFPKPRNRESPREISAAGSPRSH